MHKIDNRIVDIALYQEVAERLRQRIYDHVLKPGEWIDERNLAKFYGISRTPVREAIKVLHAEGLVTIKPHRGCFVSNMTLKDLNEIFPVMALLEGRCAFLAAQKADSSTVKHLDDLHAILEKYAAAKDIDGYSEHNYIFHEAVQELAENHWMQRAITDLRKLLKSLRGRQLRIPGRLEASLEEHRQFMRAIHRQDCVAAEKIMHDHLMQQLSALSADEAAVAKTDHNKSLRIVRMKQNIKRRKVSYKSDDHLDDHLDDHKDDHLDDHKDHR